jgi:hypothetical protein
MDLVIAICDPRDRLQVLGYFDNSVRGFSTDERRAKIFDDIGEACVALDEVRIRFPRIADQVDVRGTHGRRGAAGRGRRRCPGHRGTSVQQAARPENKVVGWLG